MVGSDQGGAPKDGPVGESVHEPQTQRGVPSGRWYTDVTERLIRLEAQLDEIGGRLDGVVTVLRRIAPGREA